jgi:hypothetical protein
MTTDALTIIRPSSIAEAKDLSTTLAASRIIPEALQKSPADVLAIVMSGAELGLAPMAALRALQMIKGKITISADGMHAIALGSPSCEYIRCLESTATVARFEAKRRGSPAITLAFAMDDARAAGLTNNATYQKFPAAMLRARCLAAICRLVFPDVLLGVYEPDELASVVEQPRPAPTLAQISPLQGLAAEAARHVYDLRSTEALTAQINAAASVETLTAQINAAASTEMLWGLGVEMKALSAEQKEKLRPVFQARADALKREENKEAAPE